MEGGNGRRRKFKSWRIVDIRDSYVATLPVEVKRSRIEDTPNPLDIAVILRRVFSFLQEADLLNCAIVNKLWKQESRPVLKKSRCIARIFGPDPCVKLAQLRRELSSMAHINGISLRVNEHEQSVCRNQKKILDEMDVGDSVFKPKYLQIYFGWDSVQLQGCPCFSYFLRCLDTHGDEVEKIIIDQAPDNAVFPSNLQLNLPKLELVECARVQDSSLNLFSVNMVHALKEHKPNVRVVDVWREAVQVPT